MSAKRVCKRCGHDGHLAPKCKLPPDRQPRDRGRVPGQPVGIIPTQIKANK